MSDHPTHKLDAYRDNQVWIAFCKVCSREGDLLVEECPGKFVSARVDSNSKKD